MLFVTNIRTRECVMFLSKSIVSAAVAGVFLAGLAVPVSTSATSIPGVSPIFTPTEAVHMVKLKHLEASVPPGGRVTIPPAACPANAPYLLNKSFKHYPGEIIPRGVEAPEINIALPYITSKPTTKDGYATGWEGDGDYIHNGTDLYALPKTIYIHCVTDQKDAYLPQ
jgi:hypothetical protein